MILSRPGGRIPVPGPMLYPHPDSVMAVRVHQPSPGFRLGREMSIVLVVQD